MNRHWFKTVFPIALLFSFRMLGLFMLIPVFTLYAKALDHATPTLIGIALGAYGLSQGLLQIPFGLWSDKIGRKPLIALGFFLFILGSLIGASTQSIYGMIFARTLQGGGAIGSVLIALTADLTLDKDRTKAMAIIGMTIGLSFSIAMVLSPLLHNLTNIFTFTALLGGLGLAILFTLIPTPTQKAEQTLKSTCLKPILRDARLWALNFGIFAQHFILTASFFALPIVLKSFITLHLIDHTWSLYLLWMGIGFIFMMPLIMLAERKNKMRPLFLGAITLTFVAEAALSQSYQAFNPLVLCMTLYFIGFNFLEAVLPSMVSKAAPEGLKGTAMGVYSTSQFLGIFCGGTLGGVVYSSFATTGIFIMNAGMSLLWLGASVFCFRPQTTSPQAQHQAKR